jgi:hypothetical protein
MLAVACEKKEKTSQYKGVYWRGKRGKWCVQLRLKKQKPICGGHFKDEMDAAKRANQLCKELGIPLQNPEMSAIPNQKYQVTKKFILSHRVVRIFFFNFFQICLFLNPTMFQITLVSFPHSL